VDALSTTVVNGTMVNVTAWYDNEMGYSARCVDLLRYVGERL
jgi:glyceraldehyde 3-phosphate dehydrogenase